MRVKSKVIFLGLACVATALAGEASTERERVFSDCLAWMIRKDAPAPAFSTEAAAHAFDSGAFFAIGDLAGRLINAQVLASISYPQPPTTLASDLSQKLGAIHDISAAASAPLVISGDPTRPNRIAATWVRKRLDAGPNDAVGVAVLASEPADSAGSSMLARDEDPSALPMLTLVLIKFRRTAEGAFTIDRIEFGQPTALAKN